MSNINTMRLRAKINDLLVEHDTDIFNLPPKDALRLGIDSITLNGAHGIKGYNFEEELVAVPDESVERVYHIVRKEFNLVDPHELSEEEMAKLCKEIVMGSLYLADYENSFGVDPDLLSSYVEGWLETKENPEEYGDYETLYDYIQSCE